jgi:hypothetical protein
MSRPRLPIADRLAKYIDRTDTCWLWTGARSHAGYARMALAGPGRNQTSVEVHRFVYERERGPIPEGARLRHTCGVQHCVNPAHLVVRIPLLTQMEKHIEKHADTGCWLWTGARSHNGYGRVSVRGPDPGSPQTHLQAHRAMYEMLVGPIPEGMTLHHTCEVRHCVNPAHHVPMPPGANVLLNSGPTAQKARLLNCPRCGSQFAYRRDGHRVCLPCKAAYQKRTWKAQRQRRS